MKKRRKQKTISIMLILCMVLQLMTTGGVAAFAADTEDPVVKTYYVGGTDALDTNSGESSTSPFATLARAAKAVTANGAGSYRIILQGDTSETEQIVFGDGSNLFEVTLICRRPVTVHSVSGSAIEETPDEISSVSGSAIIARNPSYMGDLFWIKSNTVLTLGEENGNTYLTVDGLGNVVSNTGRLVEVESDATLRIHKNIILTNNNTSVSFGGAIYVNENGLLIMEGGQISNIMKGYYGVICNEGIFHLKEGSIINNTGFSSSGSVYNIGTFVMDGGSIRNNQGGSYAYGGGVDNDGYMVMNAGDISGNTAYYGAGIYNTGTLEFKDGLISNNSASSGGGIYNYGTLEMTGGSIIGNEASYYGGGIFEQSRKTSINGGLIEGNRALVKGGAVEIRNEVQLKGKIGIPGGVDNANEVNVFGTLTLAGPLEVADKIMLDCLYYNGSKVLSGNEELIALYKDKFGLGYPKYQITEQGTIMYVGETATYYVGGPGASDSYSGSDIGSREHPFASVSKALEHNENDRCNIVLLSDVTDDGYFTNVGEAAIYAEEGKQYTLALTSISNYGSLSLGSSDREDEEISLIITQIPGSRASYSVNNNGQLNLFPGVQLEGFSCSDLVYNQGFVYIFGGRITNNTVGSSIIYNLNYTKGFHMYGGIISNNTIGYHLISGGTNQIHGGVISGNTADESIIASGKELLISGGTISDNQAVFAVLVYDDSRFTMTAGTISNNSGYGIENLGSMSLSGGTISGNDLGGIRIKDRGTLNLSGGFELTGAYPAPAIHLDKINKNITITGPLQNTEAVTVAADTYISDDPLLMGTPGLISESRDKFTIIDYGYVIDKEGYVRYQGREAIYYVDENSTAETGDGSMASPFKTIQEAAALIDKGMGRVILRSDITLKSPVVIKGSVNLLAEGKGPYTIRRGDSFLPFIEEDYYQYNEMFLVKGQLTLGKTDFTGDDNQPSLIIDGGYREGAPMEEELLLNRGVVEIYPGVSLQNNYAYNGAVENQGSIRMYGGQIKSNLGRRAGGIYLDQESAFMMEGGSITDNQSDSAGAIYSNRGNITIKGGRVNRNSGRYGGIYASNRYPEEGEAVIALNGGLISENIGSTFSGVTVDGKVKIQMSGNIKVAGGDQITIYTKPEVPGFEITGPLTGDSPAATIALAERLSKDGIINPVGMKLLSSGENYTFTFEDAGKLKVLAPDETADYAINEQGVVRTRLKEEWIMLLSPVNKLYDGREQTIEVSISDGTTTLERGRDYQIAYWNNIIPGRGAAFIYGIGDYAGVIKMNIYISDYPTPTMVPQLTNNPGPSISSEISSDGTLQIIVGLPPVEEGAASGDDIRLPISEDLLEQLADPNTGNVNISIQATASMFAAEQEQPGLILDSELLAAAAEAGKQIEVTVKDEDGKERYTWIFDGDLMAASDKELSDVNLTIGVSLIPKDSDLNGEQEDRTGLILNFNHEGELPAGTQVRIYLGDQEGIEPGSRIYLYHYNEITGQLETLPYSSDYVVDEDGYLTIRLVHCSDYVVLTKEAKGSKVASLRDQIKVSALNTLLYVGETKDAGTVLKVKLPPTLEWVDSLKDKPFDDGIGGVTISFASSNKKVATVSKTGEITAKGVGKAVITTTIKLYSGKTKTVKIRITVINPYLSLSASKTELKVGEEFSFAAKGYGVNTEELLWSSSKPSVISIDQKTGKAVAKGTAYITAKAGKAEKKLKITVK